MTPSDPIKYDKRRETAVAISIMFFAVALLCVMLGWADGVRHDTRVMNLPETGSWLLAALVLASLGILFLVRSRNAPRA